MTTTGSPGRRPEHARTVAYHRQEAVSVDPSRLGRIRQRLDLRLPRCHSSRPRSDIQRKCQRLDLQRDRCRDFRGCKIDRATSANVFKRSRRARLLRSPRHATVRARRRKNRVRHSLVSVCVCVCVYMCLQWCTLKSRKASLACVCECVCVSWPAQKRPLEISLLLLPRSSTVALCVLIAATF